MNNKIKEDVKNLTIKEAETKCPNLIFRPIEIDGESLCVTCDHRSNRINVGIKKNKIYKIFSIG